VLGKCARLETEYGCRPLLLETLVDATRFPWNLYRAPMDPCRADSRTRSYGPGAQKAQDQAIKDIMSIR